MEKPLIGSVDFAAWIVASISRSLLPNRGGLSLADKWLGISRQLKINSCWGSAGRRRLALDGKIERSMKTEHKEQLATNEPSDWLDNLLNYLKPHAKVIAAVALLLTVVLFLLSYGATQRRKNRALAWTDLFSIQVEANSTFDPERKSEYVDQLIALADHEGGSPVGAWALQYAGDISLALGSDKLWEDRDEANERFHDAADSYQTAIDRSNHDILSQRALMGLAQASEALKDFEAAKASYKRIIDQWPSTSVAKSAAGRLAFLKQPSTEAFYDWFLAQDPPAPQQPAAIPGMGIPGGGLTPPGTSDVPNPSGATLDLSDVASGLEAPESSNTAPIEDSLGTAADETNEE